MSRKKDRYFLEHHDEYLELFQASLVVETKKEMKRINKQIRERFGRGREIPTWERFPSDNTRLLWVSIALSALSLLISAARIILLAMTG